MFFETEADKISTRLKTKIFESDLPLEHKIHLRYFCDRVRRFIEIVPKTWPTTLPYTP